MNVKTRVRSVWKDIASRSNSRPVWSSNVFRHAERLVDNRQVGAVLRFRLLNPPLDFADVRQVVVHPRAVAHAEAALQRPGLADNRIEDAAVFLLQAAPLFFRAAVAEQPFERACAG